MEKMDKRDLRQITKFIGRKVTIELTNGDKVEGYLSFYSLDDQMIHLNNYTQYKNKGGRLERGQMMVINQIDWKTLRIGDEGIVQND